MVTFNAPEIGQPSPHPRLVGPTLAEVDA